jgi:hypothetical protein
MALLAMKKICLLLIRGDGDTGVDLIEMIVVFLVAGGVDDSYNRLSDSTEMLKSTSSAWVTVNNLPRKMYGIRGVTLGNILYMTGGYDGDNIRDEILKWTGQDWEEVGKMKEARRFHEVSIIRLDEIEDYCT